MAADARIQIWLEAVRLVKAAVGDQVFVRGNCDQAPFALAAMMRGLEGWLADLVLGNEELVLDLPKTYLPREQMRMLSGTRQDGGETRRGTGLLRLMIQR